MARFRRKKNSVQVFTSLASRAHPTSYVKLPNQQTPKMASLRALRQLTSCSSSSRVLASRYISGSRALLNLSARSTRVYPPTPAAKTVKPAATAVREFSVSASKFGEGTSSFRVFLNAGGLGTDFF